MQGQNKFLDDLAKLATNAMGVAQGARNEAETAMKGWIDRWLADRDLVNREEFEAVRAMAVKAREENAALAARLASLETGKAPRAAAAGSESAARPKPKAAPRTKTAAKPRKPGKAG